VEQAIEYEQGDFYLPEQRGIIEWDDVVPIRDVVAGAHPGRESDEQIVLYKNNCGEGIADVALATRTWEEVVERNLGTEIDVFSPRA
jgi:ornithine cyclodeaminase